MPPIQRSGSILSHPTLFEQTSLHHSLAWWPKRSKPFLVLQTGVLLTNDAPHSRLLPHICIEASISMQSVRHRQLQAGMGGFPFPAGLIELIPYRLVVFVPIRPPVACSPNPTVFRPLDSHGSRRLLHLMQPVFGPSEFGLDRKCGRTSGNQSFGPVPWPRC